jgi:hypothetical protein
MNTYRTTARVVGFIYIVGFIVGIGGNGLIQTIISSPDHLSKVTASSIMLAIGALLWLLAVVGDAAHGILMFPILKQYSERMAIGYLAFRIIDAVFIAIMVLFLLLQIPLASEYIKAVGPNSLYLQALSNVSVQASLYAYYIGMSILGIAGFMLNYVFYKTKLIPRWISVWGLVGYAIIFVGMLSEFMGSGQGLSSSIPPGLWEMFVGVWLIVKGFNSSKFVHSSAETKR